MHWSDRGKRKLLALSWYDERRVLMLTILHSAATTELPNQDVRTIDIYFNKYIVLLIDF